MSGNLLRPCFWRALLLIKVRERDLFILIYVGALSKSLRLTKRAINGVILIFYFSWLFAVGKARPRPRFIWLGWPGSQKNRLRRVFSPGTVRLNFGQVVASDWQGRLVGIERHEARYFFSQLDQGIDFRNTEYFRIMLTVKKQVEAKGGSLNLFEHFEHKIALQRNFEEMRVDSRPTVTWSPRRRVWILTDGTHRTSLLVARGRTNFEFSLDFWS